MSTLELTERIRQHAARIAVIGQGYVGLPLAIEFARAGFTVAGLDTDLDRVGVLNAGRSYTPDVSSADLATVLEAGRYEATADGAVLEHSDVVIICVPTPLRKSKDPDISFVVAAAEQVAAGFRPGQLVVLESTSYPGTTEELLLPMFEARGARAGVNFFLAFSPERIDPANTAFKVRDIAKIVGGVTPDCTRLAALLYRQIVGTVTEVSSAKVAELAKLYENVFRNVNIALANEFAVMCRRLGVNSGEVIDAAATKPFGFMRFNPGPGIGGHCLPVDPFYLAFKAREHDFYTEFIELAGKLNQSQPQFCVERAERALNDVSKPVRGSRILVLGVAYKAGVGDLREAPALKIIRGLRELGAEISYHDPHLPEVPELSLSSVDLPTGLADAELVCIVTAHPEIDYEQVVRDAALV